MTDLLNAREIHRKAMFLAQDAYVFETKGDLPTALKLYEEAFYIEKQAALALLNEDNIEPTRSVLFRSAAALALSCKLWREAEKMIAFGLSGNPPQEIAQELRDLFAAIPAIQPIKNKISDKQTSAKPQTHLIIVGIFKMADAEKNFIKIIDKSQKSITHQKIEVPKGLNTIVKMYFDELVRVTLKKRTSKIYELLEIEKYQVKFE